MGGHTPGPWASDGEVRPVGERGYLNLYVGEVRPSMADTYRGPICGVQSCDHIEGISQIEAEANARLIAAAPDLLAACEAMMARWPTDQHGGSPFYDEAVAMRSAIAKAEGI